MIVVYRIGAAQPPPGHAALLVSGECWERA